MMRIRAALWNGPEQLPVDRFALGSFSPQEMVVLDPLFSSTAPETAFSLAGPAVAHHSPLDRLS